jgi:RHS repeat-associated protein
MMARAIALVTLTLILLVINPAAFSQNPYTPDVGNVGLPANGAFSGGSVDTVQLNNGNVHIDIPLLHLPGIGLDTDIHLTYDSQVWNRAVGDISPTSQTPWTLITWSRAPWQTKDPLAGYVKWGQATFNWNCFAITGNPNQGTNGSDTDIDFMSFTDGDGTAHSLPVSGLLPNASYPNCASSINGVVGSWPSLDTTGDSNNGYYPVYSADQSGYRLAVNSNGNVVNFYDKHGTKYGFASQPTGSASGLPAPLVGTTECTNGQCGQVMNPSGATNLEYLPITSVEDSNGNRITSSSNSSSMTITDTVDRTITETFLPYFYSTQPSKCGASIPESSSVLPIMAESLGNMLSTIQYQDQNGAETITVCYGLAPVSLNLLCGGASGCSTQVSQNNTSGSIVVPTSIILQNGDTYIFSYNSNGDPDYMGEVTSINLPRGGTISYTYGDYLTDTYSGRQVLSRTVTANGQASTWNYHYTYTSFFGQAGVLNYGLGAGTVTDPNGNDTVFTCNSNPANLPPADIAWNAPCYMTNEVSYNGSAYSENPIATKSTGYTLVGTSLGAYYYAPVSDVLTWNPSQATTETDTTWDSFTPPTPGTYSISLGDVTSKSVYDYGSGSHGALLSKTQYTYLHQGNSAYLNPNILDRPTQVSVYNSASSLVAQTTTGYDGFSQSAQSGLVSTSGTTTQHDYTNYGSSFTLRGLPTSVAKYTSASTGAVTTYTDYNDLGKPTVSTDALGYSTKYTYGSQNAYLASTTLPTTSGVAHVISYNYYLSTGLLQSQTDQNGNQTSYTYEPLMRVASVTRPDGGTTTNSYPVTGESNNITSTVALDLSSVSSPRSPAVTTTVLDGLGRKISVSTSADAICGPLTVNTTYDLLSRLASVSNPLCASSQDTDGITSYSYDALSRLTAKQNPDGSSQSWSFNGNVIQFSDETLRIWQRTYNAEDWLTQVLEPNGTTTVNIAPTLETDYGYDALGNLLRVDQWGGAHGSSGDHVRTFAYDGISRLIASNNPESGSSPSQTCAGASGSWTTCYGYDGNSNLLKKTDNRGTSISYSYDALNRLLSKSYSDSTPPVAFTYDISSITGHSNDVGQLTQANVTTGSTTLATTNPYSYDTMGRLKGEQQCTLANCSAPYQLAYTYDLQGKPYSETFPSNAQSSGQPLVLSFVNDQAERLMTATSNWASDNNHPVTLFTGSTSSSAPAYGPMGLENASLGVRSGATSGVVALNRNYDSRGRVVSEFDMPGSATQNATASTGTITISGTEQSKTRAAAPGSAVVTVTGSDGYTVVTTYYWPCGSSHMCTPTVTTTDVYNTGALTFTLWPTEFVSYPAVAEYGNNDSDATVASLLATAINSSGGPVSATASGNAVTVTAKATTAFPQATGPSTNYPFTISNSGGGYADSTNVPYGQIGGNLAGGVTANPSDSGTVSVNIAGTVSTVSFGAGSTTTSIATALAAAINSADGGFVTASPSGGTVSLRSVGDGSADDWQLAESVTYDSVDFSSASFAVADNGMSGGANTSGALYSYYIPAAGGYDKNSNLLTAVDSVMGQWSYTYDNLNRVLIGSPASGNNSNGGQKLCWSYDAFGNRTAEDSQTAACPSTPTATATYNGYNQLSWTSVNAAGSNVSYDAAGNMLYDGRNSYLYDAEGRVCAVQEVVSGTTFLTGYVYDASGTRVARDSLTTFSCNFSSNGYKLNASWVLGLGGEQVTEYSVSGSSGSYSSTWAHTNVFAGGKLLATYNGTDTYFALEDWLGTKRAEASAGGCFSTFTGLPFGDGLTPSGNCADATEHHFTGKERDQESGNDYFGARYYASSMGRWMSPDWAAQASPVPYATFGDPQSLNLYQYVRNNPLTNRDADGHECPPTCASGENPFSGPPALGGSANPQNSQFLQMVQQEGNGLVQAEPGRLVMFGGTTELSTTTNAGFVQINSTGSTTLQAVPGVGQTVDITMHAPGATPNAVSVSAGTPVVSASATTNSATLSVGFVAGPPVKAGLNISTDTKPVVQALSNAASTVASAARGAVAPTPPPPPTPKPPPPPPCTVRGAC